jgi:hypothetical protein
VTLSVIAIALTWASQRELGAVTEFETLPLASRLSNAAVSYVSYMGKMFWPVGLVPYYPYREAVAIPVVAGCVLLLAAATGAALVVWRRAPYVTFGWLWYLGTLAPVIGIVQVGGHAMADRFTYVPLVGLFIALAWSGVAAIQRTDLPAAVVAGAAACLLLACGIAARAQTWHWRDSIAFWEHTARVTPASARAHAN